ncbi:MAG: adenylate/guanylate cyclase domain-containing protein [Planctomycetes bacterium]|nr:adenylate/guanylate cyclase domain-containing protein [Planctomycetota bacterium]
MSRKLGPLLVPLLLGLTVGLAAVAILRLGGAAMARVQVAASDLLFLRAGGPRLGARHPTGEIVLVQFDPRSASEMKSAPSYEQDLAIYRALLAAGAAVVADTRMIADASGAEASTARPLLDAMLAINGEGRLLRDIWLAGNWPAEMLARYRPLVAHNIINMHANADSFFDTRVYPLVVAEATGTYETLPLLLARRAAKLPPAEPQETLAEMKRSGVIAAWRASLPGNVHLPAAMFVDAADAPSDYQLGELRLPWYPFRATTPTVPPAGYWISYASVPERYQRISYVDATRPESLAKVKGKIVLIGFAAATDPTSETYTVPTSHDRAPGVEVAAAALETLLAPRLTRALPRWLLLGTVVLLPIVAALAGGLLRPLPASGAVASLLLLFLFVSVVAYQSGWLVDVIVAPVAALAAATLSGAERYWREVRAKSRIVDLFGRYVPKAVVNQLIQQRQADALALGGENRDVTVLFADIRGFTSYAERIAPEEVLRQLNSLLKIMVDCTFAHEGTVDKFIGDCVLVLFNAPLDQPDHVLRAARTAWAMQQGLANHASGLAVGIGVHRGIAVVGRVGTPERMEYTAIGSTVNVASRLCGVAPSGKIIVSDDVARELGEHFLLEPQPPVHVKGVEAALATSIISGPLKAGMMKGI